MRSDFKNVLKFARTDLKREYIHRIVTSINEIIVANNNREEQNILSWDKIDLVEAYNVQEIYPRHLLELEFALILKPDDKITLLNIVETIKKIIISKNESFCRIDSSKFSASEKTKIGSFLKKLDTEITELTEKMNSCVEKIKKSDPIYMGPVIIRKTAIIPAPVVKKKHFWQK